MSLYASVPCWIREIPKHLKMQEMCDAAVWIEPWPLRYVPNHLKTQKMCNLAVVHKPYTMVYVQDQCKTQEICHEAMHIFVVPDDFKTQEM